jgi:hypothetical protein
MCTVRRITCVRISIGSRAATVAAGLIGRSE